jgi:hypothetical protein
MLYNTSCILSIQSLHNGFTNSKHEQTLHLQQLCLDWLSFSWGQQKQQHKVLLFIAGLVSGTISEHSLFTFGVSFCNKLLNYSLLWNNYDLQKSQWTIYQDILLNSYVVGIYIIDDLSINSSHIHQSEK